MFLSPTHHPVPLALQGGAARQRLPLPAGLARGGGRATSVPTQQRFGVRLAARVCRGGPSVLLHPHHPHGRCKPGCWFSAHGDRRSRCSGSCSQGHGAAGHPGARRLLVLGRDTDQLVSRLAVDRRRRHLHDLLSVLFRRFDAMLRLVLREMPVSSRGELGWKLQDLCAAPLLCERRSWGRAGAYAPAQLFVLACKDLGRVPKRQEGCFSVVWFWGFFCWFGLVWFVFWGVAV